MALISVRIERGVRAHRDSGHRAHRDSGHRASWRRPAVAVLVAAGLVGGGLVGGIAVAQTSSPAVAPESGYTAISPAVKLETNKLMKANTMLSPVVLGTKQAPDDARSVQIAVTVSAGTAAGSLTVYPAGNPSGGSGQALAWTAGQTKTATFVSNVGSGNEVTFVNSSTGTVKLTATLTGYSGQVTAGDVAADGGTSGQVLTNTGTGAAWGNVTAGNVAAGGGTAGQVLTNTGTGAAWADNGHAYSSATTFSVITLPSSTFTTIGSLAVPAGTYAVNVSAAFQSGSGGRAAAYCELKTPTGNVVQETFVAADSTDVNDSPISHTGVIKTTGGTIIETCLPNSGIAQAGDVNIVAVQVGAATGAVANVVGGQQGTSAGNGLPVK